MGPDGQDEGRDRTGRTSVRPLDIYIVATGSPTSPNERNGARWDRTRRYEGRQDRTRTATDSDARWHRNGSARDDTSKIQLT